MSFDHNEINFYRVPSDMTPFLPLYGEDTLREKAAIILKLSGKLSGKLSFNVCRAISELIEPMNSYYSNLIEGNHTHPLDIEKALKKKYSKNPEKKKLQMENSAHVHIHRRIKNIFLTEKPDFTSSDFLCFIHKSFYGMLPETMKKTVNLEGVEVELTPGDIRKSEVVVGKHIPPHSSSLIDFLNLFSERYRPSAIHDPLSRIIAIAASHHRLAWIHPFSDGNGRVVRLYSEAYCISLGLDAGGLWSISRGLARNRTEYYEKLAKADAHRWNDYDGKGNLSDRFLSEFCSFFLDIIIDQLKFMIELLDLEKLDSRLKKMCTIFSLRGEMEDEYYLILSEALHRGKVIKGDLERITGKSENTSRNIMNSLLNLGLLKHESTALRAPLLIQFPIRFAPYLFPKLFPSDVESEMI